MAVVDRFPFAVATEDPLFIGLPDATRLAATLWRPHSDRPVPAILEAVPYRRRDGTIFRDREMAPYLAGHGFAYLRLDLRGSGDSDGTLRDEYRAQEQDDLCAVIAWLAAQPWCDGQVGMTGISWGGFNALQVAARQPAALKAAIALCCSDDRYADDVHYFGGCLLTEDPLWSGFMLALQATPPDPAILGMRWREVWQARLAVNRSWSETWLAHQARDAYWQHGSICEDWSRIRIPIYAISGWDDTYSDAVFRLLAGLRSPAKGLIGPWSHAYPCRGSPGPLIGYLQEALRWWRHWLKGEATGIMDEPRLRLWLQEPEAPAVAYAEHPGRWIAEPVWPSPRLQHETLFLDTSGLGERPRGGGRLQIRSPVTAGRDCGRYGGYGGDAPDLPGDQRKEDAVALTADTPPLTEDWETVGQPLLLLEGLRADAPRVNLIARLCDVAPDGRSKLLTWGALNLTQTDDRAQPQPLIPGRPFTACLQFRHLARRLPRGHRLRLALATQHWPILWPQPWIGALDFESGSARLLLPRRRPSPLDAALKPFAPVETAPPPPATTLRPGGNRRQIENDVASGRQRIRLSSDNGAYRLSESGTVVDSRAEESFEIVENDPLSARVDSTWHYDLGFGDLVTRVVATTTLTADRESFHLHWRWRAEAGGTATSEAATAAIPRLWV